MSSKDVLTRRIAAAALREFYGDALPDVLNVAAAEKIATLFEYVGEHIIDVHPATPQEISWLTSAQLGEDRLTPEQAAATPMSASHFSLMTCDLGGAPTWQFTPWDHDCQWMPSESHGLPPLFEHCIECGAGRRIGGT